MLIFTAGTLPFFLSHGSHGRICLCTSLAAVTPDTMEDCTLCTPPRLLVLNLETD